MRKIVIAQAIYLMEHDVGSFIAWLSQFNVQEEDIIADQLRGLKRRSAEIRELPEPYRTSMLCSFLQEVIGLD